MSFLDNKTITPMNIMVTGVFSLILKGCGFW